MPSLTSPCAACKFRQRNCTQGCVFAPYFPAEQRFSNVFHVYGASAVAKMLNEVSPERRKDLADSLAYHAEMRLIDPVNGCFGEVLELRLWKEVYTLELQRREREILERQAEIDQKRRIVEVLKGVLATYGGPAAVDAALNRAAAVADDAAAIADDDAGVNEPTITASDADEPTTTSR
ncbi:putative LOB domain-containing protein 36 [Iris pallida]|uniref:LOB domain-containing protein 36 n=1 Tax=Iris pallida TaxID=29817 RepID=A0AAX6I6U0_IRIPA|nr:putative LOB domain-containing protein 36 [Iris pallida]